MAKYKKRTTKKKDSKKPEVKSESIYTKDDENTYYTAKDKKKQSNMLRANDASGDEHQVNWYVNSPEKAGERAVKNAKEDRTAAQKYYRKKYTFTKDIKKSKPKYNRRLVKETTKSYPKK